MKKILIAGLLSILLPLPIIAQTIFTSPDPSCMQSAVKTRDKNFIKNFNDYNKVITEALKQRSDAEVAAWKLTDATFRQQSIQSARQTFDNTYALLTQQFSVNRQMTRSTFSIEQQICQMKAATSSSRSSRSTN